MRISKLASIAQVPAKTIRYYEEIGLLAPSHRTPNGYRHYEDKDVDRLVFIRRCRELNISIGDIKQLLDVQQHPKASCAAVDNIIAEQLARVQQTQRELALLENSLNQLARSCQHQQIEDCTILQQLRNTPRG